MLRRSFLKATGSAGALPVVFGPLAARDAGVTSETLRWPKPIGSPVLDSLRPVIEGSRHVRTDVAKIAEVARWMAYEELPVPQFSLPFGLDKVRGIVYGLTLVGGLAILFGILCLVYWAVPKGRLPWSAIWPGAALATFAIALVDYAFPFYLAHVSTIASFGTTLVFIAIVLLWFYALAIIMLGGATVNAMLLTADYRQHAPAA